MRWKICKVIVEGQEFYICYTACMCGLLALLFLVIPAVEIYVILKVGALLGAGPTFVVIAVTAVVGAALAKSQGTAVLRQLQASMAAGEGTAAAIIEGVLVLVAGVTLLAPGFITDAVGLALLLPPVRQVIAKRFASKIQIAGAGSMAGMAGVAGMPGGMPGADYSDVDRGDPPPPGVIDV